MINSNNPLFLRDQDHLAKHADMIEAAASHEEPKFLQLRDLTPPLDESVIDAYRTALDAYCTALRACKTELAAAKAEIERLKADIERMGHEAVLDHGQIKALMAKYAAEIKTIDKAYEGFTLRRIAVYDPCKP